MYKKMYTLNLGEFKRALLIILWFVEIQKNLEICFKCVVENYNSKKIPNYINYIIE